MGNLLMLISFLANCFICHIKCKMKRFVKIDQINSMEVVMEINKRTPLKSYAL